MDDERNEKDEINENAEAPDGEELFAAEEECAETDRQIARLMDEVGADHARRRVSLLATLIIILAFALAAALCLIPQFSLRVFSEAKNDTVVISLSYHDIRSRLGDEALDDYLDRFAEAGVTTLTIGEDTMETLALRGDVASLKYGEASVSADADIRALADALDAVGGIERDSYVFVVRKAAVEARLDEWLPLYYTGEDYEKVTSDALSAFVFFNGNERADRIIVGYDEEALSLAEEHGLNIALSMRVKAHGSVGYIEKTARLAREYGVSYLRVLGDRDDSAPDGEMAEKNVGGLVSLVANGGMTLVLTENGNQLSNSRFIGYERIVGAAKGDVVRSFVAGYSVSGDTAPTERYRQYRNSVIDRNIRFINVTAVMTGTMSNEAGEDAALESVKMLKTELSRRGFETETRPGRLEYNSHKYVFAVSASFAVLAAAAALAAVFGTGGVGYLVISLLLAAVSFEVTFFLPDSVLGLYPTAVALVSPCLAIALSLRLLRFLCGEGRRYGVFVVTVLTAALTLAVSAVCGFVMAALTSGAEYYLNNAIFMGTKLTLVLPLAFAAVAYYYAFIRRECGVVADVKRALSAKVRVWWLLAAAVMAAVAAVYITRSGNVSSIASVEAAMRNFIADHMAARPRTKEFLIAYPAAVLFVLHFMRQRDRGVTGALPAVLFVVSALLPVSVINTFCHTFTDVSVQYGRVINGLILGVPVAALAVVFDLIILTVYDRVGSRAASAE